MRRHGSAAIHVVDGARALPARAQRRLDGAAEPVARIDRRGIFGVDLDGRCTFINRAAAGMLGYRTESVLGRNMHELMHRKHADGRAAQRGVRAD